MLCSLRSSDDGSDSEWIGSVGRPTPVRGCPEGMGGFGHVASASRVETLSVRPCLPVGSIPAGVVVAAAHVWRNGRRATLRWWCPDGVSRFDPGDVHGTVGGRLAPNVDLALRLGTTVTQARKVRARRGVRPPQNDRGAPAQGKVWDALRRSSSVGQSASLIMTRSPVRIRSPLLRHDASSQPSGWWLVVQLAAHRILAPEILVRVQAGQRVVKGPRSQESAGHRVTT